MNCSFLVKFLPDDETLSMNSLTSCSCVKSVLTKHWRNERLPCSCFRETLGEEGREELRATRQQAPHLLHRWHEHAGGGRVRDGAAAHDDPPAHGLQPLVLSVIYQTIWHKHTCYDGVCAFAQGDRFISKFMALVTWVFYGVNQHTVRSIHIWTQEQFLLF